jgi:hypothetical protein
VAFPFAAVNYQSFIIIPGKAGNNENRYKNQVSKINVKADIKNKCKYE